MPRATGPGANGRPGLRKKIRPAMWVPRRAPGAAPAARISSQPVRRSGRCLAGPAGTAGPAGSGEWEGASDNEDGSVELVLEVPVVCVPRELHRHGVLDGHADAVSAPLDRAVLLV